MANVTIRRALGLGLEEQHFAHFFGNQPMSLTKFIHYPPTPPGHAGVNAHHDAGFLTVLAPGMTGNYFVATPHRVITTEERLSAGYFHGPSLDVALDPLPLAARFANAVAASPRHARAGLMAGRQETAAGIADMASDHKPSVYGEQLWNYFDRSYPENMALHHG